MGWNTVARFTANFMLSLAMVLGYVAVGAVFFVSLEWETEQEDTRQARFMLNVSFNKPFLNNMTKIIK